MRSLVRVGALLVAVLVCAASSRKPSEKASKSVEKEQPEMTVTAAEILAGHEQNELRWNQKFKGKVVEVSGKIESIEASALSDDPVIKLKSPPPPKKDPNAEDSDEPPEFEIDLDRVSCYLADSQVEKALKLNVGDQVTVKGKVRNWSLFGPDLSPCVLP